MKLSLDNETISNVKNVLQNTSQDNELEFRLGHINVDQRFIPGVSKSTYDKIIDTLKGKTRWNVVNDVVYYYRDNVRKIDGKVQKKINVSNTTVSFTKIAVRLSNSIEKSISTTPDETPMYTRRRSRHSFVFDGFNIDITKVVDDRNKTTYEVEVEFTKLPSSIDRLINPIKYVLQLLFPDKIYIIQTEEQIGVINEFNSLFSDFISRKNIHLDRGKLIRFENKPRNIKREDIPYMVKYSVTNKLNGTGMYLIISTKGIYILNNTDIDKLHRQYIPEFNGTILHGEWFENGFYIFDTIRFKGEDVSTQHHDQRISYAYQVVSHISTLLNDVCKIQVKTFISSGNLETDTKDIMRYMYNTYGSQALEKNDGIMYTPVDLPYINEHTLKFKFPSTMTIDFFIDKKRQLDDSIEFDIYVYNRTNNIVPFNPSNYKQSPLLRVTKDNVLYDVLENQMIVEAYYDGHYFIPTRIRHDKERPNFIGVALDVFNDIINPLELDTLVQMFHDVKIKSIDIDQPIVQKDGCLIGMRKYHNRVKKELILKYTKDKTVLDLGFGRGGDIHKYSEAGVSYIWGVEPNEDNYEEAKRRLSTKKELDEKVEIIPLKAQQTADIMDLMKDEDGDDRKADIVASFFSLTFFFENEVELDRLVSTVAGTIKKGGYFIGTTMDGGRTYEFLKGKKTMEVKDCYSIVKYYDDDDRLVLGKKLLIHLEDTIVSEQYEWLAVFDILKEKLEKRGLYLIDTSFFEPPSSVDSRVSSLSRLFRSFVFERRETESEKKSRERAEQERINLESQRKNRLKMISIDKNLAFDNRFDEDTQLVRTGTVGEGSCFFHSVLRSIDPNYVKLSPTQRETLVSRLREKMASNLSRDRWERLANGALSYGIVVPRFTRWIYKENIQEAMDVVDVVHANSISEFIEKLLEATPRSIHKRISKAFTVITERSFDKFKEDLSKCDVWVGQESGSVDVFEYISDTFNIDIYLIRDSTRKPYRAGTDCSTRYKNRKSILVLWVGDAHYEAIGRLENKKITRVFEPTDPLILKINSMVC